MVRCVQNLKASELETLGQNLALKNHRKNVFSRETSVLLLKPFNCWVGPPRLLRVIASTSSQWNVDVNHLYRKTFTDLDGCLIE